MPFRCFKKYIELILNSFLGIGDYLSPTDLSNISQQL